MSEMNTVCSKDLWAGIA